MGIISWIIVGLIAGLLAKLIMPGDDPGGFIVTTLIGMAGAVVGGFIVSIIGGAGATGFNIWSILVATLGAIILLAIYRLFTGGTRRRV
ncbi:MAG: GlsB/YeaQ/YmgE family stress response membrane protein [Rubrobacteraceae bacterium]